MSKHPTTPIDTETRQLIVAAKAGDEDAFEALLSQYEPLIDSMVRSLSGDSASTVDGYDDLRQEATIGFYRALMKFDPRKPRSASVCTPRSVSAIFCFPA